MVRGINLSKESFTWLPPPIAFIRKYPATSNIFSDATWRITRLAKIDLDTLRISIYRLQENAESPKRVYQGNDIIETPLMPGLKVSTERIFADAAE